MQLVRSNPSINMHRFYALQIAPTLFGEWALIAEWGRIGSPGRVKEEVFPTQALAEAAFAKRLNIRTRHGYICITDV
jgi:predicted DNA-binding WGR domain protein